MLCRAPVIRRDPSLAIPAASHAAWSATTRRSSAHFLIKAPATLVQALAAVARNLLGPRGAFGVQGLLGFTQPRAPVTLVAKSGRQLIAATVSVTLVLRGIDRRGLAEDLPG